MPEMALGTIICPSLKMICMKRVLELGLEGRVAGKNMADIDTPSFKY